MRQKLHMLDRLQKELQVCNRAGEPTTMPYHKVLQSRVSLEQPLHRALLKIIRIK